MRIRAFLTAAVLIFAPSAISAAEATIRLLPDESLQFVDKRGKVVGTLRWDGERLAFYGQAEKSAKQFFMLLERNMLIYKRKMDSF